MREMRDCSIFACALWQGLKWTSLQTIIKPDTGNNHQATYTQNKNKTRSKSHDNPKWIQSPILHLCQYSLSHGLEVLHSLLLLKFSYSQYWESATMLVSSMAHLRFLGFRATPTHEKGSEKVWESTASVKKYQYVVAMNTIGSVVGGWIPVHIFVESNVRLKICLEWSSLHTLL